jgi:hypothetical protein
VVRIFITHKNPPSSVGPEPVTVGPVASKLTTFKKAKEGLAVVYLFV